MLANGNASRLPESSVWLGHWIILGASCSIAGWLLSAIDQLHAGGLLAAIPATWFLMARLAGLPLPGWQPSRASRKWWKRCSKPLPASFLGISLLSLIAGALHAPNNFDALIYRMPRVVHWLMADGWEWIPTTKNNLNTRSTGFEWWTAPMFSILRTDRLIFLINLISFLFLPGIFFSLMRNMGVAARVSRLWMWLLPTGYCFAFQAASVGNDLLTAFFAVAAFDYGFRWRNNRDHTSLTLALLACAMMTAVKPVTLPLLLPFTVLFFGMWKHLVQRWLTTALLVTPLLLSSFVPTAAINIHRCGDWTGAAAEDQKLGSVEPLVGIATNTVNTIIQNVCPPVFPFAKAWNANFIKLFPASYIEANHRSFEAGGAEFSLADFQGEETAGIGCGLTLLLGFSWLSRLFVGNPSTIKSNRAFPLRPWLIMAACFSVALLAYFSRAGMSTVGRHIAPFYPFFFALALAGNFHLSVIRTPLWKWAAGMAVASSLAMIIVLPSRPLWPAARMLAGINEQSPAILKRAKSGYDVYLGRADALGPLRDALPGDCATVAYLSHSSSPELPLWKPYMKRRLRHVQLSEKADDIRKMGITHMVLNTAGFDKTRGQSPANWIAEAGGIVKTRLTLQLMARHEPGTWWLVEFPSPAAGIAPLKPLTDP
jgi:hypothetical protein